MQLLIKKTLNFNCINSGIIDQKSKNFINFFSCNICLLS